MPQSIILSRGHLEIAFATLERLDAFAQAFDPEASAAEPGDAEEMRRMFEELEEMEAKHLVLKNEDTDKVSGS